MPKQFRITQLARPRESTRKGGKLELDNQVAILSQRPKAFTKEAGDMVAFKVPIKCPWRQYDEV